MPGSLNPRARFNLSRTAVLLFDPTALGLAVLGQILSGLGARNLYRCGALEDAKKAVTESQIDLMIVDGVAESGEGYEFVRWLRRGAPEFNRHAPVLMTAAHTRLRDVAKARDCGSHFIITKPLAPVVMLERIIWIAREGRAFLLSEDYVGPDRRFGARTAPAGHPHRRREDAGAVTADSDDRAPAATDDAFDVYQPLKAIS